VVNDTGNFDEEWVLLTFGGKPQQITADKEEKLTRSRLHPTSSLVSTAVPPKVSKTQIGFSRAFDEARLLGKK
jgi:hypothetical protein